MRALSRLMETTNHILYEVLTYIFFDEVVIKLDII